MSVMKERRVRRLRKKRLWPSIVLLLLFNAIFVGIIAILLELLIGEAINGKVEIAYNQAERTGKQIIKSFRQDGRNKTFQLLKHSDVKSKNYTPVCVMEQNGTVVVQTGKEMPNVKERGIWNMGQEYHLYLDQTTRNQMIDLNNGKIKLSYKKLLYNLINEPSGEETYAKWMQEPVTAIPVWFEMDIPDSNYKLAVKSNLLFKRRDLVTTLEVALVVITMTMISIFLFLVYLVNSIVSQKRIDKLLYLDITTGGHNWLYFFEKGSAILNKGSNKNKTFWLISIELQKFRNYCICYGAKSGDELLERINGCLSSIVHKNELCARYAEAEFGLFLCAETKEELESRIAILQQKIAKLPQQQSLNFKIGVYECAPFFKENGKKAKKRNSIDIKELYHDACTARENSNTNNGHEITYFNMTMLEAQLWEHHVEERMEDALRNKEFAVYLQPKYSPDNKKLGGAEALVRWINEKDGFIPPNRFIPIFEKNGFILKLDDYMISEVARLQAEWIRKGEKVVPVSVNVSRAHFTRSDLAEHICRLVDQYGTPHNVIELELTESAFFDDKEVLLNTVTKLQEYGFAVSMDDFGAGYSSLNSLKDLPLDVIKLDAEFFRGESQQIRGEIIVKEIIQLARRLQMRIVAEGIESKEQVDFLSDLGCDLIQGYYFAKPMPVVEYESVLHGVEERSLEGKMS